MYIEMNLTIVSGVLAVVQKSSQALYCRISVYDFSRCFSGIRKRSSSTSGLLIRSAQTEIG